MLLTEKLVFAELSASNRLSEPIVVGFLRAANRSSVLVAGVLAWLTHCSARGDSGCLEVYPLIVGVLLTANVSQVGGLYGTGRLAGVPNALSRVWPAWIHVVLPLVALAFAAKTAHHASRLCVALWCIYGAVGRVAVRLGSGLLAHRWPCAGRLACNVVVAGAGERGRRFVERLQQNADRPSPLIGPLDGRRSRISDDVGGYPALGTINDLVRFVRTTRSTKWLSLSSGVLKPSGVRG